MELATCRGNLLLLKKEICKQTIRERKEEKSRRGRKKYGCKLY
jgi:hypothetical protein